MLKNQFKTKINQYWNKSFNLDEIQRRQEVLSKNFDDIKNAQIIYNNF